MATFCFKGPVLSQTFLNESDDDDVIMEWGRALNWVHHHPHHQLDAH